MFPALTWTTVRQINCFRFDWELRQKVDKSVFTCAQNVPKSQNALNKFFKFVIKVQITGAILHCNEAMQQVDLCLAGAKTNAYSTVNLLTDSYSNVRKYVRNKVIARPISHEHLILVPYRGILSANHSLSFSIKPFAQPPYPSLSGPVPQSITSKWATNLWHTSESSQKCQHLNVCVCVCIQIMSRWRLLLHHLPQRCQCGRTGPSPLLSCGC